MTLDKLEVGKDAVIQAVRCQEPSLRKHILDMGLTPGTEVTLVKIAPMGDPIEVRVRGYELTLRKDYAALYYRPFCQKKLGRIEEANANYKEAISLYRTPAHGGRKSLPYKEKRKRDSGR